MRDAPLAKYRSLRTVLCALRCSEEALDEEAFGTLDTAGQGLGGDDTAAAGDEGEGSHDSPQPGDLGEDDEQEPAAAPVKAAPAPAPAKATPAPASAPASAPAPAPPAAKPAAAADSEVDKLAARAARFGSELTEEQKKAARAARFGLLKADAAASKAPGPKPVSSAPAGPPGSVTINGVTKTKEELEAMEARAAKFGTVGPANAWLAEKKLMERAAKFGTAYVPHDQRVKAKAASGKAAAKAQGGAKRSRSKGKGKGKGKGAGSPGKKQRS